MSDQSDQGAASDKPDPRPRLSFYIPLPLHIMGLDPEGYLNVAGALVSELARTDAGPDAVAACLLRLCAQASAQDAPWPFTSAQMNDPARLRMMCMAVLAATENTLDVLLENLPEAQVIAPPPKGVQ